jgi:formylglycine-generating enzyme required for sulfatase activity
LVPSLREWLTRKQKETRRGRAELLLADRAAVWNARQENRQLPSLLQWFQIRWLTQKKNWTPPQRKMMRRATRYHAVRGLVLTACLLLLLGAGWESFGRLRARALLDNLLRARTEDVPAVVHDMARYRRWLDESLRAAYAEAEASGEARKQLHASLALLPVDAGQVEYLYVRLLACEPQEVVVLREALRPHAVALTEKLWTVLQNTQGKPGQRLRAACALADYAAEDSRWQPVSGDVAVRLVAENALVVSKWAEALRPVGRQLLPPLAGILLAEGRGAAERRTISGLYADYAKDVPDGFAALEKVLAEESDAAATQDTKLPLARRQANAAVALAASGRWEKVWPLLRHSPDPTRRSYLIDRLGPGGAAVQAQIDRLQTAQVPEVSVRRALILALGEFDQERLPPVEREALVPRLVGLYREDPDAGLHGAVGWLLRQWGQEPKVSEIDRELATGKVEGHRQWYVNGQGQTLVLVPPGEFEMGEGQQRRRVRIERCFALATREVTVAEFRRCPTFKDYRYLKEVARTEDCPMNLVTWYAAGAYCNWLSEREGIAAGQWCYLPNEKGQYAEGMKLAEGWQDRSGYRLPTVAEGEYACRAGSVTGWSMGEAEDLLAKYAWYVVNALSQSHPVGVLRPNDWGLFDLHGNVGEWCQDKYVLGRPNTTETSQPNKEDLEDIVEPKKSSRIMRGGAFLTTAPFVRSNYYAAAFSAQGSYSSGFRPARTYR